MTLLLALALARAADPPSDPSGTECPLDTPMGRRLLALAVNLNEQTRGGALTGVMAVWRGPDWVLSYLVDYETFAFSFERQPPKNGPTDTETIRIFVSARNPNNSLPSAVRATERYGASGTIHPVQGCNGTLQRLPSYLDYVQGHWSEAQISVQP